MGTRARRPHRPVRAGAKSIGHRGRSSARFERPNGRYEWIDRCVEASYPVGERWEAKRAARDYIEWLDSLPVVAPEPARRAASEDQIQEGDR
jgi:hypothetical protein